MTDHVSNILKNEERASLELRALYRKHGYIPYRMSKFEEYELYLKNKDFLVSDRVITFNDTNGKLLALKPDVTLSIIKNGEDIPSYKQRVCYNESVYRVSENTHRFKEISQSGIECIGDIDSYDIYEVIALAAESLELISSDFCLQISHLGILLSVLGSVCTDPEFTDKALEFIKSKNSHDLRRLCGEYGISGENSEKLAALVSFYGERDAVIEKLEGICEKSQLEELKELSQLLSLLPCSGKIRFDFSVVNDMHYYNGFVFRGFIDGIYSGVLAGGQYDRLMEKLGRKSRAIGFAIYLDMLEQLSQSSDGADVDILVLFDEKTVPASLAKKVGELTAEGKSVSVQRDITEKLRYNSILDLRGAAKC